MERRLHRSSQDRLLLGVAGGLGRHFEVAPGIIRAAFVVLCIAPPLFGLLLYVVFAVVMPREGRGAANPADTPGEDVRNPGREAAEAGERMHAAARPAGASAKPWRQRARQALMGAFLIVIGFAFLASNLGWFDSIVWNAIWPAALIALGVLIFVGRGRSQPG